MKPLCFVLMPFGKKPASNGRMVDFDAVYHELIKPAVESAGMEPLRADEEMVGGIIHKPMFERLALCEYAVADLTTANANVFYELGLRHGIRPWATQLVYVEGLERLPFDVAMLRAMPYKLSADGTPKNIEVSCGQLTERLIEAKKANVDSPVYQLLDEFVAPDIQHIKTDVFRDRVVYANSVKSRLAIARKHGFEAVQAEKEKIGDLADCEAGIVIDLLLSFRAVEAWGGMIDLIAQMPPPIRETTMVQEQLGFALNRNGLSDEAEEVLTSLIEKRGPSSETYGILGRVYKDRWEGAVEAKKEALAHGLLSKAIDAYLKGFEADLRDAYPGINAVTLMEIKNPPDDRKKTILPVVAYAVERRIAQGAPDYWDYATRLELAVLSKDQGLAQAALSDSLANMREPWEGKTTARNLNLIQTARRKRNEHLDWGDEISSCLENGP